jgi:hypothetical protein
MKINEFNLLKLSDAKYNNKKRKERYMKELLEAEKKSKLTGIYYKPLPFTRYCYSKEIKKMYGLN